MPADTMPTPEQARILADLKSNDRRTILPIRRWDKTEIGQLTPLTPALVEDADLIQALCRWRTTHGLSFFTVFTPTLDNVRGYLLRFSLADPARALFLVRDSEGRWVGNIGFCNVAAGGAELDNVLRGETATPRTIMADAQRTLLDWAFQDLRVPLVNLDVLASNARAIRFYERAGFTIVDRVGLVRHPLADGYRLVPPARGDEADIVAYSVRMELLPKVFYGSASCTTSSRKL